jgi:hypothetical protein
MRLPADRVIVRAAKLANRLYSLPLVEPRSSNRADISAAHLLRPEFYAVRHGPNTRAPHRVPVAIKDVGVAQTVPSTIFPLWNLVGMRAAIQVAAQEIARSRQCRVRQ